MTIAPPPVVTLFRLRKAALVRPKKLALAMRLVAFFVQPLVNIPVQAPDWSVVGAAPSLELIPCHCSRRQFPCLALFLHVPEGLLAGLVDRVLAGVNVAFLEHFAPLLVPILAKVLATPSGVYIFIVRLGLGRPWSLCIGITSIDMIPIGRVSVAGFGGLAVGAVTILEVVTVGDKKGGSGALAASRARGWSH